MLRKWAIFCFVGVLVIFGMFIVVIMLFMIGLVMVFIVKNIYPVIFLGGLAIGRITICK